MNAQELLDRLKESGTGEGKLAAAAAAIDAAGQEAADVAAADLIDHMHEEKLWPEGTLEKAREMAGVQQRGMRPLERKRPAGGGRPLRKAPSRPAAPRGEQPAAE
jgi:hypothetical protein